MGYYYYFYFIMWYECSSVLNIPSYFCLIMLYTYTVYIRTLCTYYFGYI